MVLSFFQAGKETALLSCFCPQRPEFFLPLRSAPLEEVLTKRDFPLTHCRIFPGKRVSDFRLPLALHRCLFDPLRRR